MNKTTQASFFSYYNDNKATDSTQDATPLTEREAKTSTSPFLDP